VSGSAHASPETVRIASEGETLLGDLYGALPSRRAAILVHGQSWDASGWRDIAPLFVSRGIPALALNLRGYDGSSGKTNDFAPPTPWSPVTDLRSAKSLLRERGVREIALVGASIYWLGSTVPWGSIWVSLPAKVFLLLLAPLTLYASGFFERDEVGRLRGSFRKVRRWSTALLDASGNR